MLPEPLQPQINGQLYGWAQIRIRYLTQIVTLVKAIEYKRSTDMDNEYGAGNSPMAQGEGNITFEGSIEIFLDEIQTLIDVSPLKCLESIPSFDITVSYGTVLKNKTDILAFCRFKETPGGMAQGDKSKSYSIPLLIGAIKFNETL